MHPIGLAQRIAQKLARVAHAGPKNAQTLATAAVRHLKLTAVQAVGSEEATGPALLAAPDRPAT